MISLNVENLEKRFGSNSVFKNISFSCNSVVLGIAGPNGSGKSTLLKCLSGLIKPTSGSANWKVKDEWITPKNIKPVLGFSAPYVQLYEELTVMENLRFLADLRGVPYNNIDEKVNRFGFLSFASSHYGELSTGQQQRVKLAAATLHNPSILMLDEPGSNLDNRGRELVEQIVSLYRSEKKMVIIASNQVEELDLCEQITDLTQMKSND